MPDRLYAGFVRWLDEYGAIFVLFFFITLAFCGLTWCATEPSVIWWMR